MLYIINLRLFFHTVMRPLILRHKIPGDLGFGKSVT